MLQNTNIPLNELDLKVRQVQEEVNNLISFKTWIQIQTTNSTTKHRLNDKNTLFAELLLITTYRNCNINDYKDLSLNVYSQWKDYNLEVFHFIEKSRCSSVENNIGKIIGKSNHDFTKEDKSPSLTKVRNRCKFLLDVLEVLKILKSDNQFINYYLEIKKEHAKRRNYQLTLNYSLDEINNLLRQIHSIFETTKKEKETQPMLKKIPMYNISSTESLAEYIADQLDPFLELLSVNIEEELYSIFKTNFIFEKGIDVIHLESYQNDSYYPVDLISIKTASEKFYLFKAVYSVETDEFTFEFLKCATNKLEFFDCLQEFIGTLQIEYLENFEDIQSLINSL